MKMTEKALAVYDVMLMHYQNTMTWPSQREIAAAMGLSLVTTYEHVQRLVDCGVVEAEHGQTHRCYSIKPEWILPASEVRIPIVGVVDSKTGQISGVKP